jgi:hypothetical protein
MFSEIRGPLMVAAQYTAAGVSLLLVARPGQPGLVAFS